MAKDLFFIPLGGSGGGGGDLTNYYTKAEVNALIADFVTASTNSLINYYLKSETYTQAEVNSLISAIETTHFEVYASLSDITNPQSNVLYLVGPIGNGSDKYEIYIYSNNQFVKIDDTSIDLSGYATTTDLQNAINTAMATLMQYAVDNFYQKSEVDALIAQVQTLQGIQGIKGSDGINGAQGIQGIAGQNGTNGVDGQQGIQGIQGIKGSDGINGAQGIQGIKGADGTNGVDGQQGIQGIAGQNGTNGADGLQGIQGTMGIQGPAGGGGGATRYDISTKSQAELADFYQNWQTIMASNDVYFGVYPVTGIVENYTLGDYTGLLVEYNINFTNYFTQTDTGTASIMNVAGSVGAYFILANGYAQNATDISNIATVDYVNHRLGGLVYLQFVLADDSVENYRLYNANVPL